MKKRIVCSLVAMIMLISAAVFSANASAVQIGAITIDNLREPVAGNTPDYEVKVTNGAVDLYQSAHSTENGIIWRKIVNGAEHAMKKTDVFEYGKTYSVRIYVKRQTDEDFFANSITGKIGNGFGNYVTAEARKLSSDPAVAVVSYEFECNKTAINSVAVTGITEPVPEARMNFDVTPGTNDLYDLSQDGRFVFWVDAETGKSYNDNQINEFAEGKVYIIQIYIEAKSGYDFPNNPEKVIATVNGHSAELKYDEKNSSYFIQKRFDPCGSVENIEINYAAPVVGQSPSFDKVVNYRYTSTGTGTYKTNGITWYDETAQKHLIKGTGQKFESHHVYTVTFELASEEYTVQTAQGNDYKYYEFINSSATINGELVDDKNISLVTGDRAWKYATVKYTFAALDECSPAAVSKKEATCTEKGNVAYYECTCGKMYEDADGILEITDKDAVVIPANGHKYDNDCDTTCNNCSYTRTTTHKGGTATCKVKAKCTVCGKEYGSLASHDYKAATCAAPKTCKVCGATDGKANGHKFDNDCDTTCNNCSYTRTTTHKGGTATCKVKAKCTVCGKEYGSLASHNYKAATCTAPKTCKVCGATDGKANGHKFDNACDTTCNNCTYTRTTTHKGGTATCKAKAKCTVCGKEYGSLASHNYKAATCTAPKTCKVCKATTGKALGHKYTNACDTTCNTCSAKRIITHDYKAATCTAPKTCKVCKATTGKAKGHKYTNACDTSCNTCKATRKITHSYKSVTTKATLKKNGKVETKCTVCGKVSKTTTVYYPKTIKLEYTSTTYNGKAKSPKVTVKDSKGNTLKKGTDYTVKYASGRKSIGKYTVTVTFKGKYTGTKKLTFTIVPAKATLSKVTAGSKSATVAWKSISGVTGYEVQYSTSKDLKKAKTVAVKKGSAKKTTIKKLKKGKKYYFKVRAYKTVDGKKIYGAWSAVKSTKIK